VRDRGDRKFLGRQHVVRLHDSGWVVGQLHGVLMVKIGVRSRKRKFFRREHVAG
jgi:hypothetical protein